MNLKEKVTELNKLITQGATIQCMELFYADSVSMQENEEEPRSGKSACIQYEEEMLKRTQWISAQLLSQAIDDLNDIVFSEWEYLFKSPTGTNLKLTEVSIQQWQNGLIVREKFYYKEIVKIRKR